MALINLGLTLDRLRSHHGRSIVSAPLLAGVEGASGQRLTMSVPTGSLHCRYSSSLNGRIARNIPCGLSLAQSSLRALRLTPFRNRHRVPKEPGDVPRVLRGQLSLAWRSTHKVRISSPYLETVDCVACGSHWAVSFATPSSGCLQFDRLCGRDGAAHRGDGRR